MTASRLIRGVVLVGIVLSILTGVARVPLAAALLASMVVTDGITLRTITLGMVATLVGELLTGLPVGSITLAWLGTLVLAVIANRFIAWTPLKEGLGWSPTDLIHAGGVAIVMMLGIEIGTAIAAGVMGDGAWLQRLRIACGPERVILGAGVVLGALLLVRLADQPPWRRIRFGAY